MVSSGLLRRVALVRATRRNNPVDTILHSHRRENLKSYTALLHDYFNFSTLSLRFNGCGGSNTLTTRHPSIHKSWHYISLTSGGHSVGIFR
jgi:hypothetical protein